MGWKQESNAKVVRLGGGRAPSPQMRPPAPARRGGRPPVRKSWLRRDVSLARLALFVAVLALVAGLGWAIRAHAVAQAQAAEHASYAQRAVQPEAPVAPGQVRPAEDVE